MRTSFTLRLASLALTLLLVSACATPPGPPATVEATAPPTSTLSPTPTPPPPPTPPSTPSPTDTPYPTLPATVLAAPFTTFVVNTTRDPGDGVCDARECTLREAIEAANHLRGKDLVNFDLRDGSLILLQSPLPPITEAVSLITYDRLVTLEGGSTGPWADGLRIQADEVVISSFVIQHFDGNGVHILAGSHNWLYGNWIIYNRGSGVAIASPNNTIGDAAKGLRFNIIGGNGRHGVELYGPGAVNNAIMGNTIGGNERVNPPIPGNQRSGIFMDCYTKDNVIGGRPTELALAQGNGIDDNGDAGITLCGQGNILRENTARYNGRGPVELISPPPSPLP